ncbi:hypothetical protein KSP39_PZI011360 [Platanthera zijinensis]|uniref:Uncharacterized protein n=1 Tax=Platanthera zijinensis TaxID=2320716 RepID=A0AAP0G5I9_9ASPA
MEFSRRIMVGMLLLLVLLPSTVTGMYLTYLTRFIPMDCNPAECQNSCLYQFKGPGCSLASFRCATTKYCDCVFWGGSIGNLFNPWNCLKQATGAIFDAYDRGL